MFDYIGRFEHANSALKHEQRYRVFADLERRARTPHCDVPVALRSRRMVETVYG
ncbi:hypothetical protein [Bradyrhizobium sp. Bra64]|uniref:hypothetical protein n=1 Tax=Bradyrhizobium sp. Bra64 TaxID=2926009 RepID=UPI002118C422|nr:hypothetical protein [Bradyrhizobium sp. Bra64]